MLYKLSYKLVDYLFSHNSKIDDDYITAVYGCEILLYTIISTLGLVLIGFSLHQPFEACIIIILFYTCQSSGGGYHANTHLKCFVTMSIGLILGLILCRIRAIKNIIELIFGISISLLVLIPLTLHKNKSYLNYKEKALKKKSIITTLILVVLLLAAKLIWSSKAFIPASIGLALAAISRTYAYTKEHL